MAMKLRILFTVLAALCVAALIPVGTIVSWTAAIFCALGGFLFFGLMLICKQKTDETNSSATQEPQADFFHPAEQGKQSQTDETNQTEINENGEH